MCPSIPPGAGVDHGAVRSQVIILPSVFCLGGLGGVMLTTCVCVRGEISPFTPLPPFPLSTLLHTRRIILKWDRATFVCDYQRPGAEVDEGAVRAQVIILI